ncbi:serine O-acetyltransferase EpsC [Capnocytophaga sp. G2]|jgi:Serine acetyltransferase|uniref:serine O-acetyltransferase EpsC n=1 Tax=Capnocytophaga sp. G2 TaxID=3110695 RepID=UPI002B480A50|nr:serine O-acetyltransferase EpsC [Capnocytophaga sp. G2]MEB3005389.1 serine O-acetyltransferase EpsC [Capnocytophaga sp. G2]
MDNSLINLIIEQRRDIKNILPKRKAEDFIDSLYRLLFNLDMVPCECHYEIEQRLKIKQLEFSQIIYDYCKSDQTAQRETLFLFNNMEEIYLTLLSDAQTILENDPAAQNLEEVYIAYPGFYAIVIHRFAHQLWLRDLKLLARIWSEFAHSRTGIDIHPAAQIGKNFCIDHGTGIVIGETCVIGNHVKIYQGVTLGALSVSKDKMNTIRHPKIGDNVIIYSGATILGGNTNIGHDSIIGGNVWLTESIEPYTVIYHKNEMITKQRTPTTEPIFFHI